MCSNIQKNTILGIEEIIHGCLNGKRSAQEALYKLYGGRLFSVCMRYTRNQMEAEDVLQDGFVKIFKNIRSFRDLGENSLFNWMKRIIVNTAINYLRDQKKHRYQADIDTVDMIDNDNSDDGFFDELRTLVSQDEILALIRNLPEGYRMVFNLFAMENFSHQEIAEMLGVSVNTSKSQLFKARQQVIAGIREIARNRMTVRNVI